MWFILDTKYNAVGILDNSLPNGCPFFNDNRKQQLLNGYNTLQFDVPSNHPTASLLELEGFVIFTNMKDGHELYRIKNIQERHGNEMVKTIFCEPAATSDLMGQTVRPVSYKSETLSTIARELLKNTGWELGDTFYDDIVNIDFNEYPSVLEALHILIEQFSAEIEFKIKFDGVGINKKVVNFYQQRGEKTNVIFEYGHNLQGVVRTEDSNRILTAMIGVGKEDSNGKKILIKNAQVTPPEPFVKVDDYVGDLDALERWGNANGEHTYGVFNDSNAQSATELYENTLAELKKFNKPQLTYEVTVLMLEQLTGYEHAKVSIGDTILIKDRTFDPPLFLNARVLEKETSSTEKDKGKIVLGEYVLLRIQPITSIINLQKKIDLKEDLWNKSVYKVELNSSNGLIFKNGSINSTITAKVFRGEFDITADLLPAAFTWSKFDINGVKSLVWSDAQIGSGKAVVILGSDVDQKATIKCDVDASFLVQV
jgi:phage minor structural protein